MSVIPAHLRSAYRYCARLAQGHYENFPVASVLIPKAIRPHVCAVYAFAREADDFADEPQFEGRRLERLNDWEQRLIACVDAESGHPIFDALGDTLRRFDMPLAPFLDLLSAFRQDVETCRYPDFAALGDYCRRSADPVGRIVLWLFGYRDEQRQGWSDAICTGLQLANFWQDVAVDARKGRIYLPQDDLARFGVTEQAILEGRGGAAFQRLLAFQVERTRKLFHAGKPLCHRTGGRLGLELKLIWLGGMGILDAVAAIGYDTLSRRPVHGKADWLRLGWRALAPGRFDRAYPAPKAGVAHA